MISILLTFLHMAGIQAVRVSIQSNPSFVQAAIRVLIEAKYWNIVMWDAFSLDHVQALIIESLGDQQASVSG